MRPTAALCALAIFTVVTVAHAQTKVAVVDLQRSVMQTSDGLQAQATLKKLFDRRQQDLDNRQQELGRERIDLERQSRLLSRLAFQRRMEHWQRRMVEVQTKFLDYNKELQKKQNDLTGPILRKMFRVIKRIAQRRGYDLVVDKSAVPYARTDLDLTEAVVQMYNSGEVPDGDEPGETDTPPPPVAPPTLEVPQVP